jgi:Flp pilus assembly protein TadD
VTGLLFGLHPLHVESVAWVSERKDLLYALFYMLSVLSYMRYAVIASGGIVASDDNSYKHHVSHSERGGSNYRYYMLCLMLFMFSLMSKPMAVTLPAVLLLLDVYPLERFTMLTGRTGKGFLTVYKVFIEKIPFLILSVVSSVIAVQAQEAGDAMRPLEILPLGGRFLVAFHSLVFYLYKMVWPKGLVPFYPYPTEVSFFSFKYIGSILLITGITVLCVYLWRRRQKVWGAVWVYYVITLVPVLGIVQVGWQAAADRYVYLPSLGCLLFGGLGIDMLWGKTGTRGGHVIKKTVLVSLTMIMLIVLTVFVEKQLKIWKDSLALWSAELEAFPGNAHALVGRGRAYFSKGDLNNALEQYNRALKIDPEHAKGYFERGLTYLIMGNSTYAIQDFNRSLFLNPKNKDAYLNRNLAYKQAIKDYSDSIRKDPGNADFYINRGNSYAMIGQLNEALEDFSKAISLKPELATVYYNRGIVYSKIGDEHSAVKDFQTAAALGIEKAEEYLRSRRIDRE